MRSASNLSVEEKIKVCAELYQRGMSTRDIQAATGIGKSSIPSYLKAAGVQPDAAARISAKMTGKPGHRKGATHSAETKLLIGQKNQLKKTERRILRLTLKSQK
jgi:transposase